MTNRHLPTLLALGALVSSSGCFLFGGNNNKDPLKDLTVEVSWYEGDTRTILPAGETAVAMKSNRDFYLTLSNSQSLTRVEVKKVINGVTASCDLFNDDGTVRSGDVDWPGSNTEYTITAYTDASSKTFGPFTTTVTAPGVLVTGTELIADQGTNDDDSSCFFQSRHLGWGTTANNATWQAYLVRSTGPRIVDFAFLTVSNQLRAVSPDLAQSTHAFTKMTKVCGWLGTTFQAYTGTLDPSAATKPTLAEVQALPNPPATATTLDLSSNMRFVYRTGDGKKGLIKVGTITLDAAGHNSTNVTWASEQ